MANDSAQTALKGIVFDMDGTLIDSLASTFSAFHHAFKAVGARPHSRAEIARYFGRGEDQMLKALLGPEQGARAYEALKDFTSQNLNEVILHEGISALLDQLHTERVPISIFTGRSWATTESILKHHGILDRFITVVADDHVSSPKPSPEGLLLALTRMKLAPEQILFVGDSHFDMQAARACGAPGVAATWDGLADEEKLKMFEPKHWAKHPSDVWKIWKA